MTEMRYWTNSTNRPKKLDVVDGHGGLYYTVWIEPGHALYPPQAVLDHINSHPDHVRWDPEDPKKQYEVWLEDGPLDGQTYLFDDPVGAKVEIPYVGDDGIYGAHVYQRWGVVGEAEVFQYVEPPKPPKPPKGGAFDKMMKAALKDYEKGLREQLARPLWNTGKDGEPGPAIYTVKKGDVPDKPHPFGRV